MKHFPEEVWTDFVRGIGQRQANKEIEAHLASGCRDCVTSAGMWKKVCSIASNEPSLTPPDYPVRMVNLEFATSHSPKPRLWSMAKLVFDSLSQPLTAGVRSGAVDSRQMVFDADGTMVDLVFNALPQSGTISLVGQVVDKDRTKVTPRQVAIILWTETGQPVTETTSNEFGEFQMEFASQDRLRLSVEIAGHKQIRTTNINLNPAATRPVT